MGCPPPELCWRWRPRRLQLYMPSKQSTGPCQRDHGTGHPTDASQLRQHLRPQLVPHPPAPPRPRYVNSGGLAQLYEIMLESSQPEMGRVLQLVLEAAEAGRPTLF